MYQDEEAKVQHTCGFCGRILETGFNYTCHVCGATFCYSHRPDKCDHRGKAVTPLRTFSPQRD